MCNIVYALTRQLYKKSKPIFTIGSLCQRLFILTLILKKDKETINGIILTIR